MKKLRITLDGKVHEVTVEFLDQAPAAPVAPAAAPAAPAPAVSEPVVARLPAAAPTAAKTSAPGDVRSPLAGKLVSIDVKVGQTVAEGAQVATVEAMKMNTYVFAPKTGTVSAVSATPGQPVEEGHVILVIN